LDRVDVPVQVHHGDADVVCPVGWSRATVAAMRTSGVRVDYREYAGEGHAFGEAWQPMVQRSASFLDAHV
jgi:dipeptidyl aminopeptidase/acylaminoacyl peptidase